MPPVEVVEANHLEVEAEVHHLEVEEDCPHYHNFEIEAQDQEEAGPSQEGHPLHVAGHIRVPVDHKTQQDTRRILHKVVQLVAVAVEAEQLGAKEHHHQEVGARCNCLDLHLHLHLHLHNHSYLHYDRQQPMEVGR
jgi:hypothetical protein